MLATIFGPLQRNISYRFAAVASLPALLFLSILGGFAYAQIYGQAYNQLVASVEFHADAESHRLGESLNTVASTIQTLADNSTIANGLIDSAGRETYLTPLLEGFSVINGMKVDLILADFLGTTIAASGEGGTFLPFKDTITDAIEKGQSTYKIIDKNGQQSLLGIEVLIYSRTTSGEGALVYLINLDELFGLFSGTHSQFETSLVHLAADHDVVHNGAASTQERIMVTRPLPVKPELSELGLVIHTMTRTAEPFSPLHNISVLFVVGSVVVLVLVIGLSLWLGRKLTQPLQHLKEVVSSASIHDTPPLDALINGHDEIGSLADSFNTVFSELREINLTLEQKVEDRTREFKYAKEEADRANTAKSEFLSSMSHELRTPLNAILGFAQVLELNAQEPLSKRQLDATNQIMKGGEHLLDLINDVLNLAQIETGHLDMNIEPVDTRTVVDECVFVANALVKKMNVTIDTDDFTAAIILADRVRFKQVLLNLLSNAVKYNRHGGKVRVTSTITDDGMQRISVIDNGPGIPADLQPDLFKPFTRLGAENSNIEGTGIGLTITKSLVEAMGGRIDFESTEGVGATFCMELPMAAQQHTHITEALQMGTEQDIPIASAGCVLYIEDNPDNISLMQAILANVSGVELKTAHTGELGVAMAFQYLPDLILMDINLPGMNGMQALAELRNHVETRHIPAIAISADAMPKEIEVGMEAGFMAYLTKPFNVAELTNMISDVLLKDKT